MKRSHSRTTERGRRNIRKDQTAVQRKAIKKFRTRKRRRYTGEEHPSI